MLFILIYLLQNLIFCIIIAFEVVMKKKNIIINILLIFVFVASIIALGLISNLKHNYWDVFNTVYSELLDAFHPDEEAFLNEYYGHLRATLCLTFSVIFSALSTLASAVTFCLLNFKVWKNKD